MYKVGVKRGVLIAFCQIFSCSCVITGLETVIYETNPVFLCIMHVFFGSIVLISVN